MSKHLVRMAREMGLKEVRKKVEPRVVIKGRVNGYDVNLFMYDSDFDEWASENNFANGIVSSGIINAIIAELKTHGFEPAPRAASQQGSQPPWKSGASSGGWKCPHHPDATPKKAHWGKMFCTYSVPVDTTREDGGKPDWARDEAKEFNGQWRWYCSSKEA